MLTEIAPGLAVDLSLVSAVYETDSGDGPVCFIIIEGLGLTCDRPFEEILSEVRMAQSPAPDASDKYSFKYNHL